VVQRRVLDLENRIDDLVFELKELVKVQRDQDERTRELWGAVMEATRVYGKTSNRADTAEEHYQEGLRMGEKIARKRMALEARKTKLEEQMRSARENQTLVETADALVDLEKVQSAETVLGAASILDVFWRRDEETQRALKENVVSRDEKKETAEERRREKAALLEIAFNGATMGMRDARPPDRDEVRLTRMVLDI